MGLVSADLRATAESQSPQKQRSHWTAYGANAILDALLAGFSDLAARRYNENNRKEDHTNSAAHAKPSNGHPLVCPADSLLPVTADTKERSSSKYTADRLQGQGASGAEKLHCAVIFSDLSTGRCRPRPYGTTFRMTKPPPPPAYNSSASPPEREHRAACL